MGQRGPVKGSRPFGVVRGGKSSGSGQQETQPRNKRPAVPKWLPPEGRKFLRKLIPQLEAILPPGELKEADAGALAFLALHYAIVEMAAEQMKGPDGKTLIAVGDPEHPTADGEDAIRKHPLLSVIASNSEKFKMWVSEFALTPAARVRLNLKPPKGASALEKFLAGKKY